MKSRPAPSPPRKPWPTKRYRKKLPVSRSKITHSCSSRVPRVRRVSSSHSRCPRGSRSAVSPKSRPSKSTASRNSRPKVINNEARVRRCTTTATFLKLNCRRIRVCSNLQSSRRKRWPRSRVLTNARRRCSNRGNWRSHRLRLATKNNNRKCQRKPPSNTPKSSKLSRRITLSRTS